jgi:hypothetical protein
MLRLVETRFIASSKPGHHEITWDASAYPSGVYFYKIQADDFIDTRKMLIINENT